MTARYAIYYAPRADVPLWRKASAWLGRDAFTGEHLEQPTLAGLEAHDLAGLTAEPRQYGFHATLKAPFELASGLGEVDLLECAERFAAGRTAFEIDIDLQLIGRFVAFHLSRDTPAVSALHAACLTDFERFRAPLTDRDLARRRKASLTPQQDARLLAWGYPYVLEDFRFHMTLTGTITELALRDVVLDSAREHFADEIGPHRLDSIAVFKQTDRDAPFTILTRHDFRD